MGQLLEHKVLILLLISHITSSTAYKIEPKIVKGFSSEVGQFSYFVHLKIYVDENHEGDFICGGSLITERFILTAAHCVYYALRVLVVLGAYDLRKSIEPGRKVYSVLYRDVFIHPSYDPTQFLNDVALIQLPQAVTFNYRISKILFPNIQSTYKTNEAVVAMGFGLTSTQYKTIANTMQYIELKTVTFDECRQSYKFLSRGDTTVLCAKGENGRSVYAGDSGGPLIYQNTVIGISSFINFTDLNRPQAFTYVVSFLPWINGIIHGKER